MIRHAAKSIPLLVGLLLTGLTLGSFLGRFHWTLDVLSHFNLQYAAGLLLCVLLGLAIPGRRVLCTFVPAPALLANLVILAPYFLPPAPSAAAAPETTLQVATLNIHTRNEDYAAVVAYLQNHQPDVVMLTEAEPALMVALNKSVAELYPYVIDESVRGTLGLALLSQHPFITAETVPLLDSSSSRRQRRMLRAEIDWRGSVVTVYGAHPLPPLNNRWAARRDTELHTIQTMLAGEPGPLLLLGDFNASPWAYPMRHLLDETELRHAARGFGLRPTWYLANVLGAPLDHILVSADWTVTWHDTSGDIGSDHQPVRAELTLLNHKSSIR